MSYKKPRRKISTKNILIVLLSLTAIALAGMFIVKKVFMSEPEVEVAPVVGEVEIIEEEEVVVEEEPKVAEPVFITDDCGETLAQATEADERFTDTDSLLVLANKNHTLPDGYAPSDLRQPNVRRTQETLMRDEAASALEAMFNAAEADGAYLYATSGYRSAQYQEMLFNNYAARDGACAASRYSSRPGHSDHQTGLTCDISLADGRLWTGFEETTEGKWLAVHAHEYGFIMRYPKDKEQITGYIYEPWHFRYVGIDTATEIYDAGIYMSFEEFFGVY
ncbi:MAG: M15 family metallopeptidase [Erysipelotrichaceae bacterium]|nr:M15 family metallopeptidase [Erysipelotrichaceae bacterium]